MRKLGVKLLRASAGAVAIEHGLLIALLAVGLISALSSLGVTFGTTVEAASASMESGVDATAPAPTQPGSGKKPKKPKPDKPGKPDTPGNPNG